LENDVNRKKIKRGPGKQRIEGKQFRLAQEINYIQRRAAAYDARFNYHIEGRAFVYADREAGRIITILGYPTAKIAQLG
jgi:hypothetical protein